MRAREVSDKVGRRIRARQRQAARQAGLDGPDVECSGPDPEGRAEILIAKTVFVWNVRGFLLVLSWLREIFTEPLKPPLPNPPNIPPAIRQAATPIFTHAQRSCSASYLQPLQNPLLADVYIVSSSVPVHNSLPLLPHQKPTHPLLPSPPSLTTFPPPPPLVDITPYPRCQPQYHTTTAIAPPPGMDEIEALVNQATEALSAGNLKVLAVFLFVFVPH